MNDSTPSGRDPSHPRVTPQELERARREALRLKYTRRTLGLSGRIGRAFLDSKLTPLIIVGALLLGAFRKLTLAPGQTARVVLEVPTRALAHWDPESRRWTAEPGPVELVAGASCRDLRQTARLTVEAD